MARAPKPPITAGDPATTYAQQVVGGFVPAGPHVRAQCARHIRDLAGGSARGIRWDLEANPRDFVFQRDPAA